MTAVAGTPSIRIHDGSFYLDAAVYEAYFGGLDSVAVLRREQDIAIVALRSEGAAGSLAKIRNARGDRVIHAREFLRSLELDGSTSIELEARWDPELSALRLRCPAPEGARNG